MGGFCCVSNAVTVQILSSHFLLKCPNQVSDIKHEVITWQELCKTLNAFAIT